MIKVEIFTSAKPGIILIDSFNLYYFNRRKVFRDLFNLRPWEADVAGSFEEAARH